MSAFDLYTEAGGKPSEVAGETIWNFGWIPPHERDWEQEEQVLLAHVEMPVFKVEGFQADDVKKVTLWECWNHPLVIEANGFPFTGIHQITGSCVGAGGGNCIFTLIAWEIVRLQDPEIAFVPFWLLPYGRSRFYMGARGRGVGSTGATFAKAAREDGVIEAKAAGLPPFTNTDGLVWGRAAELTWSDGGSIAETWLAQSRKHVVKTTAPCRNAGDVRQAICNGYPCTQASMYGFNARVEGTGGDAVLMGRRGPRWSHQMSILAWWEHPRWGELFWIQNQWGLNAHGRDPSGGPAGGVWVSKADIDWICRSSQEVYAFSQFAGFPAQRIPWII